MRMRRIVAIAVLIASAVSLALALRPTESIAAATPLMSDDQPVVEWIGANAVRLRTPEAGNGFADMQPLKKMIGNARIVSLGEATHGTREFFQLKHRVLEFLASEMGFTIFSIEANMPEAYRLNDYVLNGNGDPAKLIKGMYFWTWDTQEVLDMVLWMREFNKSGKGRVQFTGFDMQTPNVAADIVRDFVDKNDPEYADALRKASDLSKAAPQAGGASFGVATTTFPVQAAAGKRIRYSGYIKTENISRGWAGLWWRVDGNSGVLAFDNMHDRGASGTTDWKRYEIDLPVAADAKNINFGVLHAGDGSAWFDSLAVELDGVPYQAADSLNLDFELPLLDNAGGVRYESTTPLGFHAGGNGYEVRLDRDVFHSGKQSLRMKYGQGNNTAGGYGPGGIGSGVSPRVDSGSGGGGIDYSRIFSGKDVTSKARVLEKPQPTYTEAASQNQISGTVVLRAVFSSDGSVTNIHTVSGLPDGLTERAIAAAKQIRFVPATKDGHPVSMWMQLEYNFTPAAGPKLAVSTWQDVVRHLEESRPAYAKKNLSTRDIEWAIQNARVVLQCMQLRANQVSRDRSMADNIKWILDQNPGAKVVLWAHNGHVSTAANGRYDPMGASLRNMFGGQMVVFGFAFNQGSFQAVEQGKGLHEFTVPPAPPGSLDATFAATGIPLFALDLRAAPKTGPVATWLSESHKTRSIGALFSQDSADQYLSDLRAPQSFDLMLFVEKTTAARKNP